MSGEGLPHLLQLSHENLMRNPSPNRIPNPTPLPGEPLSLS